MPPPPAYAVQSSRLTGALLSPQKERVLENGLVGGHAYTLTGIRKVGGTSPFGLPLLSQGFSPRLW